MPPPRSFQLIFLGDVMLGRLIDQLLPNHVHEPSEARIIENVRRSNPALRDYSAKTPWGSTLSLLQSSDLNIINLETSVTTHPIPWPDKVFNYRMHPANIEALKIARVDYASLANNHTLDFGEEGLVETVETLRSNHIEFAGAGRSADEAQRPVKLSLPNRFAGSEEDAHTIKVFSAADHPRDWSSVPSFHLIDYSAQTKSRLRDLLQKHNRDSPAALNIFSVHWGPNYSWHPSDEIRDMAHFLIDECGVDVIHGHSSHHVQGIERYKTKLIIYGCGDFVEDYAVTPEYRNDLSALWRLTVNEIDDLESKKKLKLRRLEMFPTRIKDFQTNLLDIKDPDHEWVRKKIMSLSRDTGMKEMQVVGKDGQLIIEL